MWEKESVMKTIRIWNFLQAVMKMTMRKILVFSKIETTLDGHLLCLKYFSNAGQTNFRIQKTQNHGITL